MVEPSFEQGPGAALGSSPTVQITTDDEMWCGGAAPPVELTANVNDPDADLESLRWIVDGVLLEESFDTFDFTSNHVVKAVARDARGGTSTDTKQITCASCDGTANPCSNYTGYGQGAQAACLLQPGCTPVGPYAPNPPGYWVCSGSRTCEGLEEAECDAADGCGWEPWLTWAAALQRIEWTRWLDPRAPRDPQGSIRRCSSACGAACRCGSTGAGRSSSTKSR